ncbi:MAG TPA: hypothetical protein VJC11_03945 [Patescibacteria group bacterium]|nr:hypothetical protein [Patescibacteria group bacterium]
MDKVNFEITSEEIERHADNKLSSEQVKKVPGFVENDMVLWENIEASIKSAIAVVVGSDVLEK